MARALEYLVAELRARGDKLCDEAADTIVRWKNIADTRQEAIEIERAAYRSLHNDTIGPL